MTFIVTGCGGQLGSNIFYQLQTKPEVSSLIGVYSTNTPILISKDDARVSLIKGDLTQEQFIAQLLLDCSATKKPLVVIHTAAVTAVADAFKDPERCNALNVDATRMLAKYCAAANDALLIHISTDMVFGSEPPRSDDVSSPPLFLESSKPTPLSVYGKSKLLSETAALVGDDDDDDGKTKIAKALVVRVPLMFGVPLSSKLASAPGTFLSQMKTLLGGGTLKGFKDETRTPLSFWDAASAIIKLATDEKKVLSKIFAADPVADARIVHVAGPTRMTRLEMLEAMCDVAKEQYKAPALRAAAGLGPLSKEEGAAAGEFTGKVEPCSRNDFPASEPRPADLSLSIAKYCALVGDEIGGGTGNYFRQAVFGELARWVKFGADQ